eukprot:gnl/MRDRNA2_/MRDRNA2_19305_c0_seq2.p1 gnl/MRDRNA2_/MRDRNA2_19305_c0~~gnl/MRDRNA2_/MRDRNA2_19305_c0_seq2.p1  ORF type:complete len:266 (+),score=59.95 gnl/MRDRNA2_/MRDRNA2_19305_c0_seq2:187-984(+)
MGHLITNMHIRVLKPYYPSEEEKADAKLFAQQVQKAMGAELQKWRTQLGISDKSKQERQEKSRSTIFGASPFAPDGIFGDGQSLFGDWKSSESSKRGKASASASKDRKSILEQVADLPFSLLGGGEEENTAKSKSSRRSSSSTAQRNSNVLRQTMTSTGGTSPWKRDNNTTSKWKNKSSASGSGDAYSGSFLDKEPEAGSQKSRSLSVPQKIGYPGGAMKVGYPGGGVSPSSRLSQVNVAIAADANASPKLSKKSSIRYALEASE